MKLPSLHGLWDRDARLRLALVLGITLLYALLFAPLHRLIGGGVSALSLLPVMVAGWSFGLRGGLLAGLLALPLSLGLFSLVGQTDWAAMLKHGGGPGFFALLLGGALAGYMGDLRRQAQRELRQRRRAEEALQRSEERYRTLVENLPIGLCRSTPGPEGRLLMANPALLNIFGFDAGQDIRQLRPIDYHVNPENRLAFSERLLAQGSVTGAEYLLKKQDGTPFWAAITARVIREPESGETAYFDCAIQDITARKQAEQQRLALAMEQEKSRALADFIEATSHEFGSALSVINTNLHLLRRRLGPGEHTTYLETLADYTTYINRLVQAMLNMNRLNSAARLDLAPLDVGDLLEEIRLWAAPLAGRKGLAFTLEANGSLPPVLGDALWLRQVLEHLVENALDYTEAGAITLRAAPRGEHLAVEVSDTGVGIPPDEVPHVFEHFYRVDKARSQRKAGLGLSIAARVAQLHGGRIEVESAPGRGSTFRVLLPIPADGDAPDQNLRASQEDQRSTP